MSNYVISGAGRGIGLELCRQLSKRGESVIALCRQSNSDLVELGVRTIEGIDVTSDESMGKLASELEGVSVDVLINNAGVLNRETLDDLNFDSIRQQFEINSLGPLRLSSTVLPRLGEGGKIAIVTSRMGSITDNGSGSRYGYRASKAAVNIIGVSLARDLESQGISVALLHPGMVSTDMTGHSGIDVSEAASGLIARIDGLNIANSGTFWHANGEVLPW
ncbi:MAG: NAD(P)-dependent dehydrogenase (short-subunit alcohol dehydrogenase family) [Parasphingorhabdus sp.]|jgi:NAD(P)-dependent dehydrogenase (short-subunit alcohol dehydrogenase family)